MKLEIFFIKPSYHAFHTRYAVLFHVPASCPSLMEFNGILDLHTTSHYLLIEDAVTMRNESKFPNFPTRTSVTQCIKAAHSRALATTAHSHLSTETKKQLTKKTHSVSETSLAKLNKLFLSELYGHSKLWMFKHIAILQKRFTVRTSLEVTLSVLRMVLLKKKLCVY